MILGSGLHAMPSREPPTKRTIRRIAALRPRSTLAYRCDMSRVFAAWRLTLHSAVALIQRFPPVIRYSALLAILALGTAYAEQPVATSESTAKQANEQQSGNQDQSKPQDQTRKPGVEFVPTEDISEDTSVPFPVDI